MEGDPPRPLTPFGDTPPRRGCPPQLLAARSATTDTMANRRDPPRPLTPFGDTPPRRGCPPRLLAARSATSDTMANRGDPPRPLTAFGDTPPRRGCPPRLLAARETTPPRRGLPIIHLSSFHYHAALLRVLLLHCLRLQLLHLSFPQALRVPHHLSVPIDCRSGR